MNPLYKLDKSGTVVYIVGLLVAEHNLHVGLYKIYQYGMDNGYIVYGITSTTGDVLLENLELKENALVSMDPSASTLSLLSHMCFCALHIG